VDRPKLLWHSNAPHAPTGYGVQTALFIPRLVDHYQPAVSAFYGLEGAPLLWEKDIPILPGLGGEFGGDYLIEHATRHFKGDPRGGLVVTLMDVWVLPADQMSRMNMACWVPVDHKPVPPRVLQFFLRSEAVPIAMSRFGERELRDAGLDPLYVPHGVDTGVYRPYDQAEVRKTFGLPADAFLIGMVAANKGRPSRKGFQQAFEAFAALRETRDDAMLYLHTTLNPNVAAGEDLPKLMDAVGLPEDSVRFGDQYKMLFDPFTPRTMAKLYSAMDVLLNPASGEGFGIPVLEAQACGTPAIVTDFSAMQEVCGAGWKVEHRPWWTGQDSWQAIPDVDDIVEALRSCYGLPKATKAQLAAQARQHAEGYAVDRVLTEHMLPALEAARERFDDRKPVQLKVAA
jgi:glycosyltransferase involved in cell wall biosynthesis